MRRQTLLTLLTAAMLVLAGCAGSTGGDGSPTTDGTTTPDIESDDTDDDAGGTATGTVQFYVSDDPGQIEDFRHLNVTISQIGFQRAGGAEDGMENESEGEDTDNRTQMDDEETMDTSANGTTGTQTTTDSTTTASSATANHGGDNQTESGDDMDANETDSDDGMPVNDTDSDNGMVVNDTDSDDGMAANETDDEEIEDDADDGEESGDGWITRNVSSRSVDLTQLRGDNATLIDSPELPAGEYGKVFVYVSDINATLTDGTSVNVKLPSNKLQLNKGFTLEPNGTVSFVYDITVFKAGNSGKYILKPVISQSGADQKLTDVDDSSMGSDEENGDDSDSEEGMEADGTPEAGSAEKGSPPDNRGKN